MKFKSFMNLKYESPKANVVTLGVSGSFLEVSTNTLIIATEDFGDEEAL